MIGKCFLYKLFELKLINEIALLFVESRSKSKKKIELKFIACIDFHNSVLLSSTFYCFASITFLFSYLFPYGKKRYTNFGQEYAMGVKFEK